MTDPYGTAAIRARVLAAWAAAPARFREDANAESDAASGDVVAELAQNAYDAAHRAGVAGALRIEVVDGVLYAANTGAPLDAAGVEALCHLRASAKASGVGRFGVGFKAVLAVTDEPTVFSRAGGIAWSRARTAAEVAALPSLAEEVARRRGEVPVMRLPYVASPDAHATALLAEYDTVVALPLRAPLDLSGIDETLLLTLPLDVLVVDGRMLRRDPRWVVRTDVGVVPPELLADRPVEERERDGWSVTVGVPPGEWTDRRLRAPQPTEERVDVPVFVSISVPLEPSRRHVVPGPLTSWLVARAAETYVALLESLPPSPDVGRLLPASIPAGPVDLALREALAPLLPRARLLATPAGGRVRADAAVAIDAGGASGPLTRLLAPLLPALVEPDWLRVAERLGARVLDTADVVDLLHSLEQPPSWWAGAYTALAEAPDRDALRALPVPLADGRVVTGPPGVLLPMAPELVAATATAGVPLRWVHPDACAGRAAEVLRGAGADVASVGSVLDELRDAVEASLDDDPLVAPEELAAVVLRLLAADPAAARDRRWLGALALPSAAGDLRAADELLLPAAYGGRLVSWVVADSPFGIVAGTVVETYGAAAVEAAGVLRTFAVATEEPYDVDREDEYGGTLDVAVRDLEWVRGDAWSDVLSELARLDADQPGVLSGYTLWWLGESAVVPATDGRTYRACDVVATGADAALAAVYPTVAPLDADARGVVALLRPAASVADLDDAGLADLAGRLGDPEVELDVAQVRALHAALADTGARLAPSRVRAWHDGALRVVPREDAYALDRPDLLPLLTEPWVPVDVTLARRLADVLGLRLASSLPWHVTSTDPLHVDGIRVAWFAGEPAMTDGSVGGAARLLAWQAGRWAARYAIEADLRGDLVPGEDLLDP